MCEIRVPVPRVRVMRAGCGGCGSRHEPGERSPDGGPGTVLARLRRLVVRGSRAPAARKAGRSAARGDGASGAVR